MKIFTLLFLLCSVVPTATSQEAVFFYTRDSSKVNASLLIKNPEAPFIILCRNDKSEIADYQEIALRLLNLNYNCLTIDVRTSYFLLAEEDIRAAIRYANSLNKKPVVLFGSGFSASVCLLLSVGNPQVKAIVALSPGEYFEPVKKLSHEIVSLIQPVFVTFTKSEDKYIRNIFMGIKEDNITLYCPNKGNEVSGYKAFMASCTVHSDYWFALTLFFRKIQPIA